MNSPLRILPSGRMKYWRALPLNKKWKGLRSIETGRGTNWVKNWKIWSISYWNISLSKDWELMAFIKLRHIHSSKISIGKSCLINKSSLLCFPWSMPILPRCQELKIKVSLRKNSYLISKKMKNGCMISTWQKINVWCKIDPSISFFKTISYSRIIFHNKIGE